MEGGGRTGMASTTLGGNTTSRKTIGEYLQNKRRRFSNDTFTNVFKTFNNLLESCDYSFASEILIVIMVE